jgi:hypothetical protein
MKECPLARAAHNGHYQTAGIVTLFRSAKSHSSTHSLYKASSTKLFCPPATTDVATSTHTLEATTCIPGLK